MKQDLLNGVMGLVTLFVIGTILVVSSGCAATVHGHDDSVHGSKHAPPKVLVKGWKPGKRCRDIGKEFSVNVGVLVQRDCVRKGVTSVVVVAYNTAGRGAVAGREAVRMIHSILGFKPPSISAILVGKDFMIGVIGEKGGVPLASAK